MQRSLQLDTLHFKKTPCHILNGTGPEIADVQKAGTGEGKSLQ